MNWLHVTGHIQQPVYKDAYDDDDTYLGKFLDHSAIDSFHVNIYANIEDNRAVRLETIAELERLGYDTGPKPIYVDPEPWSEAPSWRDSLVIEAVETERRAPAQIHRAAEVHA